MTINNMTTQAPSNVIEPEIVISVEQPENEDNTNSCTSNNSCNKKDIKCYFFYFFISPTITFIGLIIILYIIISKY